MTDHNPFTYDNPVPVERHVNRQKEIRTLFSRLKNGDSTAIVGKPRIGKTSLLDYIAAPAIQWVWLNTESDLFIPVKLDDKVWLNAEKSSKGFWLEVLNKLKAAIGDETIQQQITQLVEADQYSPQRLNAFFRKLGRRGQRVILLIDNFDLLLTHANLWTAEFLGPLRSIVTRTDGLQIITTSMMSLADMNDRAPKIMPFGSPLLNYLIEVKLRPLSNQDVDHLLDQAPHENEINFDAEDRTFIIWLSGHHPYRVQMAGAFLFDAIANDLPSAQRYVLACELFYQRTAAHFADLWQHHLNNDTRMVMLILSAAQSSHIIQPHASNFGQIKQPQRFAPELRTLEELGLVEKVAADWPWEQVHLLQWLRSRWRVVSGGLIWLLANVLIGRQPHTPDFQEWLHEQEQEGFPLSGEQWQALRTWPDTITKSVTGGAGEIVRQFASEFLAKKDNN